MILNCVTHIALHILKLASNVLNPFHATGLFRYPLKTSENLGFLIFLGVSKETSGMKWVSENAHSICSF